MHIYLYWVQKITLSHGYIDNKRLHAFVILWSCKLCSFGSKNTSGGRSHKNPGCFWDKLKVLFSPTVAVELAMQNSTVYSVAKRTMKRGFTQGVSHHSCLPTPPLHAPCGMPCSRGHLWVAGSCLCAHSLSHAHTLTLAVPNKMNHCHLPPAFCLVPGWISSCSSDTASCITSGVAISAVAFLFRLQFLREGRRTDKQIHSTRTEVWYIVQGSQAKTLKKLNWSIC